MLLKRIHSSFPSITLLALATAASAQGASRKVPLTGGALRTATLDLATGSLTRGPSSRSKAFTTVSDFPNLDLSGFVGTDTGSGACEWIDAGVKGISGNKSDIVTSFAFAYCSSALDVQSGGPGGATTISFREGYQLGGGSPGTEIGRFSFTGLPANTGASSILGGTSCYLITIDLGSAPLCFADGEIGYGWRFDDVGTDGALAATIPLLSGIAPGSDPDPLGQVGLTDRYCPPGTLVQTFSSSGSMSMDLREIVSTAHITTVFNPTNNPVGLTEVSPANLGTLWSVDIDCSGQALGGAGLVRVTTAGKLANPVVLPQGSLYIGSGGGQDFGFIHSGDIANVGATLPTDPGLAGLAFQVQGYCGQAGGGGRLSNALCSTVGVP